MLILNLLLKDDEMEYQNLYKIIEFFLSVAKQIIEWNQLVSIGIFSASLIQRFILKKAVKFSAAVEDISESKSTSKISSYW